MSVDSLGGLVKSAGIVLVGTVIANFLGIFAEILIPRALPPTVYGRLGLAYGIIGAMSSLAILGIPNGVTRFLSADKSTHKRLDVLWSGYTISIIGSVVAAAAIYLARFEIAILMDDPQIAPLLVAFIPYLLAFPVAKVSVGVLRAQERTIEAVLAQQIGPRVVGLALALGFITVEEPIFGAFGYWLSFSVLGAALGLYFVHQWVDFRSVVVRLPAHKTLRELWSFSWPLAASASLHILLSNVDIIMLGYFTDSATVGYYRVIQPLKQMVFFFTGAFAFLFLPLATKHYSTGDLAGLNALYTVTTKWIVWLTFPVVLVFTLFSPGIIRLFFGESYLPASPALSVLIAGLFYRVLVGLNGDMVKAIDRPRIEFYSAFTGVIVNIIMNATLIPLFGIVGAAFSTVVGYFVYNTIEIIAIYREIGSYPFSAGAVKPLLLTAFAGIGVLAFTSEQMIGLVVLVSLGITMYAVEFVSIILTRSISDTDILLIEQFESRFDVNLTRLKKIIRRKV
nr:flippase [Halomarina salina]